MQLAYCSLNGNSFPPQAQLKPEVVVKLFALMITPHICGDGREKWHQAFILFFTSWRQWADPTKEALPSPQEVGTGRHRNGDNVGKWFFPHYTQVISSAGGELALSPSSFLPITLPCKALHYYRAYTLDCGHWQSLSLFFVFTCSAFLRMNKMYRSHPVTTEWYLNHVSGMHMLPRVSSDAAWSTAYMCYPSSPNPSPLQGHA